MADEELEGGGEETAADTGGKKKKVKPPKPVKAPKEKKLKGTKPPKVEGEKSGGIAGIIIIMVLVAIILIGGFVTSMYFGILGTREVVGDLVRQPMLDFLIWLDPRLDAIDQRLTDDAEAFDEHVAEKTAELDEREYYILQQEEDLEARLMQVERQAVELDSREAQIIAMYERTMPLHRRIESDEDLEEMLSISEIYSQMSPNIAATILINIYDPRDVAAILFFMNESNAASILTEMEPHMAAEITEILLYQ